MNKILIFCPCAPYCGAESLVTLKLVKLLLEWRYDVKLIYHQKHQDVIPKEDPLGVLPSCMGIVAGEGHIGNLIWCIKSLWTALHLKWEFKLVISRAMPFYAHIPALLLKLIKPCKWLVNWSDPYPQIIAPKPYGKGKECKIPRFQSWLTTFISKKADWITFPSPRLMEWVSNRFSLVQAKSSVFPHIMLEGELKKITNNICIHNNCLALVYAGSLTKRNPEIILQALQRLQQKKGTLQLMITFIGARDNVFEQKISQYGLDKYIKCLGPRTYADTCSIIAQSDIALLLEAPCEEGIFLSSKLLDYLQFAKPIFSISPFPGMMSDLLKKYGGGLYANCVEIEDIENKFEQLLTSWQQGQLTIDYNVTNLRNNFSVITAQKCWREILANISMSIND